MSSENSSQVATANDAAFSLQVKYKCKSAESMAAVVSGLKTFVHHQLNHPVPGVLLYHFSRPDPEGQPLLMQFCELYTSVDVFFANSENPELRKTYAETFFPTDKNMEWAKTFAYGLPVAKNPKMKELCETVFHASLPTTVAGYLIRNDPLEILAAEKSNSVLMTCEFTVKASDADATADHLKSMAGSDDNKSLMFHAVNVDSGEEASTYQITAIYVNNSQLIKHLQATKTKFQELHKLSSSFSCLLFGEVSESSKSEIEICAFPVQYRSAEAGYVLHPAAATAFQN